MQGPCRTQSKIWDFILCGMGISWRAWAVDLTWLRSRFRRVPLASVWRSGSARLVVISRDEVWESVSPPHMNLQVANFPRCKLHSVNVRHGWHRSLPSVSYRWPPSSPTVPHLFSFLPSVTLLACLLDAIPCVPAATLYYSRPWAIRLEASSLLFVCLPFMYYLCEKYHKHVAVKEKQKC